MTYQCICGRKFENSQSLKGHQSHCSVHLAQTGRKPTGVPLDVLKQLSDDAIQERKRQKAQQWLDAQHRCECCGKVMTQKYGSGRFCSKACANTHVRTAESKQKTSESLKKYFSVLKKDNDALQTIAQQKPKSAMGKRVHARHVYANNPRLCIICGRPLPFEQRTNQTCSTSCYRALLSQKLKQRVVEAGGNLNPFGPGASKYGTYRGYPCDSSWELAFLMYHLDHGISIKRNHESFEYTYNGAIHKYYPDFIVNNEYVEIKNYDSDRTQAKRQQFPVNKTLRTLFKKDIQPYLQYCIQTYGAEFYTLYDEDRPSWMNKKMKV